MHTYPKLFILILTIGFRTAKATQTDHTTYKRILVLSLDYDGCLMFFPKGRDKDAAFDKIKRRQIAKAFNPPHVAPDPHNQKQKWHNVLREEHAALQYYIYEQCEQHTYDHIIVICGSNRQSAYIDMLNAAKKENYIGSCMQGLPIFIETLNSYLQDKLKNTAPSISLDKTLMHDLLNDKKNATTYDQILQWLETPKHSSIKHPLLPKATPSLRSNFSFDTMKNLLPKHIIPAPFQGKVVVDQSKISLHYASMHRMAIQHPHASINYTIIDDNYMAESCEAYILHEESPKLLNACNWVFETYPSLIPSNITYQAIHYAKGTLYKQSIVTIKHQSLDTNNIKYPTPQKRTILARSQKGVDENYTQTVQNMITYVQPADTQEAKEKRFAKKRVTAQCLDLFREMPKEQKTKPSLSPNNLSLCSSNSNNSSTSAEATQTDTDIETILNERQLTQRSYLWDFPLTYLIVGTFLLGAAWLYKTKKNHVRTLWYTIKPSFERFFKLS